MYHTFKFEKNFEASAKVLFSELNFFIAAATFSSS